jgi:hypothetical protein
LEQNDAGYKPRYSVCPRLLFSGLTTL